MSAKQDRTYTRTASDLERKLNLKERFSEVMGVAEDARSAADEAANAKVGNNILLGTAGFTGNDWRNMSLWQDGGTFNGFAVKTRTGAWNGLGQYINVVEGEVYTISAYVKSTGEVWFSTDCGGYGTGAASESYMLSAVPEWTRISNTFTATKSGTIAPGYANGTDGSQIWACAYKIEKGNKATEWCPQLTETTVSPESVFNALTNNGQNQGLFRGENGELYINASYIVSGILASLNGATSFNLENGTLVCRNENGSMTTLLDKGSISFRNSQRSLLEIYGAGVGGSLTLYGATTGNTIFGIDGVMDDVELFCWDQDEGKFTSHTLSWKTINGVKTLVGE